MTIHKLHTAACHALKALTAFYVQHVIACLEGIGCLHGEALKVGCLLSRVKCRVAPGRVITEGLHMRKVHCQQLCQQLHIRCMALTACCGQQLPLQPVCQHAHTYRGACMKAQVMC